jgi:hypothetical protein
MKYPLTPTTKEAAKAIVQAWDAGEVQQRIIIIITRGDDEEHLLINFGASGNFNSPNLSTWRELSKFGLVDIQFNGNLDILLLQELRNAVQTDFEVSDYFLTMNAVGNIIINSTTGTVQGVGYNTGQVSQTLSEVADDLTKQLGESFLESQTDLRNAIDALREANEANQQSKLGKVISELGRCLDHGSNAASVTIALTMLIMLLSKFS